MTRRDLRPLLALAVLAVACALVGSLVNVSTAAMYLAPALVLALPLLAGRYVGERQLARLARARPPVRRPSDAPRRPQRPRAVLPRGPRLIGAALAVRPPPPRAAT